jgi:hypothetical protein
MFALEFIPILAHLLLGITAKQANHYFHLMALGSEPQLLKKNCKSSDLIIKSEKRRWVYLNQREQAVVRLRARVSEVVHCALLPVLVAPAPKHVYCMQ